jgi:hypothetical protein
MTQYALAGLTVESELPLPELARSAAGLPDTTMRILDRPPARTAIEPVFEARLDDDGSAWMRCGRGEDGYIIDFPDLALFTLSFDGRLIAVHRPDATPDDTVRHLCLDQVFPLALSLRGELVLHAAGVATPAGAAAFLGDTGEGKSTLAASFAQAGVAPLADDCLVVRERRGRMEASNSYPGLRLWPDAVASLAIDPAGSKRVAHYSDKQRVPSASSPVERPVSLRAIYVLAADDEPHERVTIASMSKRDAVVALLKHAYRIASRDRDKAAAELARLDRVSELCRIRRLAYPRRFAALDAVRAAILEDIARG